MIECTGIESIMEIIVVGKIDKVGEDKKSLQGGEIHEPNPPCEGRTNQVKAREPRKEKDWHEDQKRETEVKLEPEVEGPQKVKNRRFWCCRPEKNPEKDPKKGENEHVKPNHDNREPDPFWKPSKRCHGNSPF
jgi:hypothetical protein